MRTIKVFYRIILSFLASLTLFVAAFTQADVKGAVCIIKADNRLVMVNEILTQKASLPAGTIDDLESAQAAAQREAWEETGLVVTVGKQLIETDNANYYDCISDSEIIVFSQQDKFGSRFLPVWFAPHYGIEISSAKLVEPAQVDSTTYRYPEHWPSVLSAFELASDQPVKYVDNLFEAAPSFNQVELGWLIAMRNNISQWPSTFSAAMHSFLSAGLYLTSSWWLLVLIPVVYAKLGRAFTFKLLFTVSVTSVLTLVGQQGFHLPAPHAYLPSLNLGTQSGFSLPNVAIAIWAAVITLLINRLDFGRYVCALLLVMLWVCIAQFYTANAFLLDVLAGGILGWLCAWHIVRVESDPKLSFNLIESKGVWALIAMISGVVLMLWQTPSFLYLAAAVSSLFLARLLTSDCEMGKVRMGLTIVALLLGNGLIHQLQAMVSNSNFNSLLVEAIRWPLLIVLFLLCLRIKNTKA